MGGERFLVTMEMPIAAGREMVSGKGFIDVPTQQKLQIGVRP